MYFCYLSHFSFELHALFATISFQRPSLLFYQPKGLEDSAHIVQKNGDIYSVVLGLVDVVRGTNSFYKLQALEKDSGSG